MGIEAVSLASLDARLQVEYFGRGEGLVRGMVGWEGGSRPQAEL